MYLKLEIFRNKEKVNEITTEDPKAIYKYIAQIYKGKEDKTTTKTTIKTSWGRIHEATQFFDQNRTQIKNITYTYKYIFEDVDL